TWAGNGSDQLPMPVLFVHPGKNYMLSATGILSPSMSLELSVGRAQNSLNYQLQMANLYRSAAGVSGLPLLFPDAVQSDYIPWFEFRGGRTSNAGQYQTHRGPFTNENKPTDVIANLSKVWGSHSSKFGVSFQHSFKPQSIFASFNSDIQFQDDSNNPFDTGYGYANAATGVFRNYIQANKYALPEWNYNNFEWYGQDNWKANKKLTLDYGVPLHSPPAPGGQAAEALALPAQPVHRGAGRAALPAGVHRRLPVLREQPPRHGPQARQRGRDSHPGQHR